MLGNKLFNNALAKHKAGKHAEAIVLYKQLLMQESRNIDANYLLGTAYAELGQFDDAEFYLLKAYELKPDSPYVLVNLGNLYKSKGSLESAIEFFRKALSYQHDLFEALYNLGTLYHQTGKFDEAAEYLKEVIKIKPEFLECYIELSQLFLSDHNFKEALSITETALKISPYNIALLSNHVKSLFNLDNFEAAHFYCKRILKQQPGNTAAMNDLGTILHRMGRLDESVLEYRKVIKRDPDFLEAHKNLATTLFEMQKYDEAEEICRNVRHFDSDALKLNYCLANILCERGRMDEAEQCYRRALEISPGFAEGFSNLGSMLAEMSRYEEAESCFRKAVSLEPDLMEAHSNLLFCLNYDDRTSIRGLYDEACAYGKKLSAYVDSPFSAWKSDAGKLRVGFVTADLRNHPVGYFVESLLQHINRAHIELYAYTTTAGEDDLTLRVKPFFSSWNSLTGMNDADAAQLIYSHHINILIDLSGHTSGNRLPVFAWKPAPVQATWAGYLATTGVREIDYLIGDICSTPPEIEWQFTEKIQRMPDAWACFSPPGYDIEIGPLPAAANGYVTFGSLNNLRKMNDFVVQLWSRVLKSVENSRLFLKSSQLNDPFVCDRTIERFAECGIGMDRLILEGSSPRKDFLAAYNSVDIALDPFPYGGGTTTFEAFWMAVPVVTMKGERFLSRCGYSLAINAGLPGWVAENGDDYVEIAVKQSANLEGLASLRAGLRSQVLDSPLYDGRRFADNFENALLEMWEMFAKK